MIFVESYDTARYIAEEIRKHYGLTGEEASDLVPYYHSILDEETKRRTERRFREGKACILITTEALTMGADFPGVELIINFLTPALVEIWLQRSGRGARKKGVTCLCVILVTKGIVNKAAKICRDAKVELDPVLLAMKVEEGAENEGVQLDDTPIESTGQSGLSRPQLTLGMAEYIATGAAGGCLTEVIDRAFKNPAHTSCFDVGSCESCIKRRREQEPDAHKVARQEGRLQEALEIKMEDNDLEHKEPALGTRTGDERNCFTTGLVAWRRQRFLDTSEVYDISLEEIMTTKELGRIARLKGITKASDFDRPEVKWPGLPNWRLEVLVLLSDMQRIEDNRLAGINEQALLKVEGAVRRKKAAAQEVVRKKEEATHKKEEAARKKEEAARVKQERVAGTSKGCKPVLKVTMAHTVAGPSSSNTATTLFNPYGSFSLHTPNRPPHTADFVHKQLELAGIPSPVTPSPSSFPLRSQSRLGYVTQMPDRSFKLMSNSSGLPRPLATPTPGQQAVGTLRLSTQPNAQGIYLPLTPITPTVASLPTPRLLDVFPLLSEPGSSRQAGYNSIT
ncbi:nucleolar DEAD-box protein required for synthesis of 60S ribosomal subunit [Ceratobasidium sp. 370]|nr:nucleolar DEAD-box protein required for synthesis of 60S ribosomal subunit [Ceratobasidium sp. 370]